MNAGKRGFEADGVLSSVRPEPPAQPAMNEVVLNDYEWAVAVDSAGFTIVVETGKPAVASAAPTCVR